MPISVIIPTLWRCPEITLEAFSILEGSPYVNEVIVINNAPNKYANNFTKVKNINVPENIYVNPAWNLGVSIARNYNLCIMNDDIILPKIIFKSISLINLKLYGVLGMHSKNFNTSTKRHNVQFFESKRMNYGFGTAMFLHKDNYCCIPDSIKIYLGDSYLYDINAASGKKNIAIRCNVFTKMSTTSSGAEFDVIKASDLLNFKKIFNNLQK